MVFSFYIKIMIALIIIIAIILLFLIVILSKIRIEIRKLKFTSLSKIHFNNDYKIILKLRIFNKIDIFKYTITKEKIEKMKYNKKIKQLENKIKQNKNKIDIKLIEIKNKINIEMKKLNLEIEIGTEDAVITSMLVPIISIIISIIIKKQMKNYEKQKFLINPVYNNQNFINIIFDGIFEIKMIHIINIIYIINRKEGVKKNDRTSNRRSYGYSYE